MTSAIGTVVPSEPLLQEYSRLAERYDKRWAHYIQASTRETLARLTIRATDRVLDVGCGTGVLLAELGRRYPGARLAGVDAASAMLEVARHRLPPAVELHRAWADRLPFAAASFDVVVSNSVFHFLSEPLAALREWARVLREGGSLVITDWCGDYRTIRALDWYLRRVKPAHARVYRAQDLSRLLHQVGYRVESLDRYRISWSWGLMTATAKSGTGL